MRPVIAATEEVTDWRAFAACMSADPDLFFPISTAGPALGQAERAKAVCAHCQARLECLDFALATGQVHGVWGGTTEEERRRLRTRRQRRSVSATGPRPGRPQWQGQRGQRRPAR